MKAFLSHSSKDKEFVGVVSDFLGRQYSFLDEKSFETGVEFKKSIEDGLDESSVFVLFASKNSLPSIWVKFEVKEAWFQLLQQRLSKSLVYLIDSDIDVSCLPEWLQRASVRRFNVPKLIARDIRYHLDEILRERQSPYFTGRSQDIEAIEEALTPLAKETQPHSLFVSGLPGIGRRSLIKRVIPSLLNLRKFVEIRVGEGDKVNDICISIADSVEPYSTIDGLKAIVEEIRGLSDDDALQRISRNLVTLVASSELPILVDDGGFMDSEGRLQQHIEKLIKIIQETNRAYVSFVSYRRPTSKAILDLPIIHLKPLGENETKRLLKLLASNKALSISPDHLSELAEYVAGYPPAAYFTVQQVKEYGIDLLLRDKSSLVRFTAAVFLRHFANIGLSEAEQRLLRLLAFYSPLPLQIVTDMLELDKALIDKTLVRMIDLAFVITTDYGYYRIADPVRDAAIKAFGFPEKTEHPKVASLLFAYLNSPEFEGPKLQLSRLLFKAAHISGDTATASKTLRLTNDLIILTEILYHQREYSESIQVGYMALEERPDSFTARSYLIRALIQEEKWPEAEKQINELRKYAPNREVLYLQGFLERNRHKFHEAIRNYKESKRLGRRGSAICRELAYCHFLLDECDPAADYIKEAIEIRPDDRYVIDLSAQIALKRRDKTTAQEALRALEMVDPIYYHHRLSTFERVYGTPEAALTAASKACESQDSPPLEFLAQLMICQLDCERLPEARKTLEAINRRFSAIRNDLRQCLRCKLEIADGHFGEALRVTQYITNKDTIFYKRIRRDALRGEIAISALSDKTRAEYKRELARLEKEVSDKEAEDLLSIILDTTPDTDR